MHQCPLSEKLGRTPNTHQLEPCDVTSRHIFEPIAIAASKETPPQLNAEYESNNSVNKHLLHL